MKNIIVIIAGISLTLLSGCFVCSETAFPETRPAALAQGRNLAVQLSGFEAVVTTYVPIYEYGTVLSGRPMSCRRRAVCYSATYVNQTYVPQSNATTVFAERAAEIFEKGGYVLQSANPQYRVEVKFDGPFVSDCDSAISAMWSIFSAFTAGYGTQTWSAKLKIYDMASGRLVYHKDYSQKYEAVVWGPVPLFSPAASSTISYGSMQSWCLSALTDMAVSDAMTFFNR